MTPTEVLSLVVTPGEYHIVARVGLTAGAGPVAALMTLYEDGVNIAQGETIIGSAGWPGTITLDANVAPSVDTTYTVEISGYNAALTAVPYAPNSTGSVNTATCIYAFPLGISGAVGPEGPPGPATQVRFTAGCGLEYSTDSGATWLAVPGWLDNAASCFAGFNGGTIPAARIDPGSPPVVGDGTVESRACNIAAYLAQVVLRGALNKAQSDAALTKTALEFGAGLAGLVLGFGIGDVLFVAAAGILYDLVDGANLADFTAAAADETLWSDVTCAIYGAILADGEVTAGNFAAVGAALNGITYTHAEIPTALALFWGGLGVEAVRTAQVAGALNVADCSGCGGWCAVWDWSLTGIPDGWCGSTCGGVGTYVNTGANGWYGQLDDGNMEVHIQSIFTGVAHLTSVRVQGYSTGADYGAGSVIGVDSGAVALGPLVGGAFDFTVDLTGHTASASLWIWLRTVYTDGSGIVINRVTMRGTGDKPEFNSALAC
jgi:hypothetical protein